MSEQVTSEVRRVNRGIRNVAFGAAAIFAVALAILFSIVWELSSQNDELQNLSDLLNRPLVVDWEFDLAPDAPSEFVVGEAPIPMVGTFRCSDQARKVDPLVQFVGTFRAVEAGSTVNRAESAPLNISVVCNEDGAPVEFEWPWTDELVNTFKGSLFAPTAFEARLGVSAVDGSWLEASATTPTKFTLIPADSAAE